MRFLEFVSHCLVPRFALLAAIAIVGLPTVALGADADKRRADFQRGVAAIGAEKWDEALAVYRKLWEEEHTYDVALSLGQVELNLKAYRDAAEHLDFGVRNIPPREEAGVATRAHHMLDLARKEVGAVEIRVDRTNAEVSVDGKPIGTSPLPGDVFLDPGPHTIGATNAGSTPIEQAIQASAGKRSTLNLAFGERSGSTAVPVAAASSEAATTAPAPAAQPPASSPGEDTQGAGDNSSLRTGVLIGGLAVTAIAAAVTVTFALKGSSASSDADDARVHATARFGDNPCASAAGAGSPECAQLNESLDSRASDYRIANAALFVSVAAGLSTAVTFFLWPSNDKPEHALRFRPEIGRHAASASLTGSF